jgi:hypothetical protein
MPLYDPDRPLKDGMCLIEPPPNGKAAVISIGFIRLPDGRATVPAGAYALGDTQLSTGEYAVVFARQESFDYERFKAEHAVELQERYSRSNRLVPEDELFGRKSLRLLITNDPVAAGFLKVMEVGVRVSRRE